MSDIPTLTQQGIAALKAGDKSTAYDLLSSVIRQKPDHQLAWIWLSGAATSPAEVKLCLEKAVAINPTNELGKRAADGLRRMQFSSESTTQTQNAMSLASPNTPSKESTLERSQVSAISPASSVVSSVSSVVKTKIGTATPKPRINIRVVILSVLIVVTLLYFIFNGYGGGFLAELGSMAVWMGPFVVGFVIYIFMAYAVRTPARELQRKFVQLGDLKGMTKEQLLKVVGQPSSITHAPDYHEVYQWILPGYHIAIVFKSNICQGISHEAFV